MSKALTCGGKGPCCHIGYSHRHCEHCDVVIDTRAAYFPQWPIPLQPPLQPLRPYWGTTVGNQTTFGNVTNAQLTAAAHDCESKT